MRTHPHAEATYRVVELTGGGFAVEVVIPQTYPATVSRFDTAAAAEAWIVRNQARVQSKDVVGKWFRKARPER